MYGYKVSGCYGLRIKEADFLLTRKLQKGIYSIFLSNYLTISVFSDDILYLCYHDKETRNDTYC